MQRDRCRDGSVIGKVLLPGRLGDELADRRWIRVARTSANPRRDTDAAVAVGFGQCGSANAPWILVERPERFSPLLAT